MSRTSAIISLSIAVLLSLGCHVSGRTYPDNVNKDGKRSYVEVLDAEARIFIWHHFLTDDECDYLKMKAGKRLSRSGVVDTSTGGSQVSDIRTSDGMFFSRAEDPIIEAIERRIAEWTLMPVQHGEGFQVLRYKPGQKYEAHWDYFFDKTNAQNGGNRYSTVLTYLSEAEEGGETVFPKIPAKNGINEGFSECAKYSLAAKTKKGDAILFHSMKAGSTELEERSLHTACPVLKGEKWSMPKWIHANEYMMNDVYNQEAERHRQRVAAHQNTGVEHDADL